MRPQKSKKRSHSVEGDSEETDVSNKDLLLAISALTDKVSTFENSLSKMVDEKVAALEKNVMDQIESYKQGTSNSVNRIEKRMEDLEKQIVIDMSTAKDEQTKWIEDKINQTIAEKTSVAINGVSESRIDQLERQVRMNEVVISGVPYVENEKVIDIVTLISRTIKFSGGQDAIESCFRLPAYNNRRRSSPSIIVRFWGADAKVDFIKCYFSSSKLCTTMLGHSAPSRIYVNENLTKRNFEIFCQARDLKKNGKIVRFSTQRGRVVVKLLGSERSYTVDTVDQLSSLANRSAAQSNEN